MILYINRRNSNNEIIKSEYFYIKALEGESNYNFNLSNYDTVSFNYPYDNKDILPLTKEQYLYTSEKDNLKYIQDNFNISILKYASLDIIKPIDKMELK